MTTGLFGRARAHAWDRSQFAKTAGEMPRRAPGIETYSQAQTKSALHFGPDKPLPASLVRKLLDTRMAEGIRRPVRAQGG
jgi:hypothetical protein